MKEMLILEILSRIKGICKEFRIRDERDVDVGYPVIILDSLDTKIEGELSSNKTSRSCPTIEYHELVGEVENAHDVYCVRSIIWAGENLEKLAREGYRIKLMRQEGNKIRFLLTLECPIGTYLGEKEEFRIIFQ